MNKAVILLLIAFVGASCAKEIQPPVAAKPEAKPTPAWTEDQELRIFPLGDSITRGIDNEGYRTFLYQALHAEKIKFHFVGSLSHGPEWLPERDHDGHSGWVIDQLTSNIDSWLGIFQPNVILLMIGSNDIETDLDVPGMPGRLEGLLGRIAIDSPQAEVLVSEVTLIRDPFFDSRAESYNLKIKEMVPQLRARGLKVTFVPMHDVLDLDEIDLIDHPNAAGNQKIAARWMNYLNPILLRTKSRSSTAQVKH